MSHVSKQVFCLYEKVKTKVLISCAVTAQLISSFAFTTRMDSTMPHLHVLISEISSFLPLPVTVQAHLCRSWSETLKTSFLILLLKCIYNSVTIVHKNYKNRSRFLHGTRSRYGLCFKWNLLYPYMGVEPGTSSTRGLMTLFRRVGVVEINTHFRYTDVYKSNFFPQTGMIFPILCSEFASFVTVRD